MDRWLIVLLLIASWTLSLYLMFKLLRSESGLADKVGGTVLLLLPFAGPLLYWFVYNRLPPQASYLQNRDGRGAYTHKWLGIRPVLEEVSRQRRAGNGETDQGK